MTAEGHAKITPEMIRREKDSRPVAQRLGV